MFRTITDKVKSKITKERKVSFGIYPTPYEEDYIYVEYFSPKIQKIAVDKETINNDTLYKQLVGIFADLL